MATDPRTADYLIGQVAALGTVDVRKMFGEYGVWCDGKTVALLCDDQLFVKPTPAGRAHVGQVIGGVPEAPAYPGAKPGLVIDPDLWADAEWLGQLFTVTAAALPAPKPRPKAKRVQPD